jgi:hypothetical protein
MPGEDDKEDEQPITGSDPAGQQQPKPAEGAQGAPTEQRQQEEGVLQVKHGDFKRIKDEARDKGRAQALADLDAKAKSAGFESMDDALKKWAELSKKPQTQSPARPSPTQPKEPQPMPKPGNSPPKPQNEDALRRENLRAQDDKTKMRKQWRQSEAKRRELERALAAKQAEMGLREEMFQAGVRDVDYAVRLLTRELEGKTQEEIAKYDRPAFYGKLRTDKPYLFGESVAPATTGVDPAKAAGNSQGGAGGGAGANGAPATPAPGAATAGEAGKNKFDAMKAKPEEVQQRLRELGLNPQL